MCMLPNFSVSDLRDFERNRKRIVKKVEPEIVKLVVSEQLLVKK